MSNALQTPLKEYNSNNCLEIYQGAIMERITTICVCRQHSDFITFHIQLINIKEPSLFVLLTVLLKSNKKYCCDDIEHSLSFI